MTDTPAWLDTAELEETNRTGYPPPLDEVVAGRFRKALGTPFGLTNFGVNMTRLAPGAWSALRHWHLTQDEFILVLEGELMLCTEAGESRLGPGMCAGFPKGRADGHCLINRGLRDAVYLEVGDRAPGDVVTYPDVDMVGHFEEGRYSFTRQFTGHDGTAG
ncbi:cupin domain-containing protein [Roseospirillum parvum]|uniref:Uncharacterized conserved protein, cupin superfamily n=1 Tax=Roseospirillum parvum TaxID=83401 RepID=A0A1G7WJY8_9PROT|nr:cupin domain-containing protein [Roseospirillum parvum]SDG72178.1 Uncharacterized conserved protein, cupin superfamily [Roseospirillum parvum]